MTWPFLKPRFRKLCIAFSKFGYRWRIVAVQCLKFQEITDGMRDRLLKLGLTPDFVDGPHYAGLLDRLVQKPDFEVNADFTFFGIVFCHIKSTWNFA